MEVRDIDTMKEDEEQDLVAPDSVDKVRCPSASAAAAAAASPHRRGRSV